MFFYAKIWHSPAVGARKKKKRFLHSCCRNTFRCIWLNIYIYGWWRRIQSSKRGMFVTTCYNFAWSGLVDFTHAGVVSNLIMHVFHEGSSFSFRFNLFAISRNKAQRYEGYILLFIQIQLGTALMARHWSMIIPNSKAYGRRLDLDGFFLSFFFEAFVASVFLPTGAKAPCRPLEIVARCSCPGHMSRGSPRPAARQKDAGPSPWKPKSF